MTKREIQLLALFVVLVGVAVFDVAENSSGELEFEDETFGWSGMGSKSLSGADLVWSEYTALSNDT